MVKPKETKMKDDGMWTEEEMADFRNQFDGENELGDSFSRRVRTR